MLKSMRRPGVMVNLKRKLLAGALLLCVPSTGVLAQRGDDKKPPKGQDKVVVKPKERPPSNDNRGGDKNKGDKKGKGD
jgi:hypothetical protein